MGVAQLAEHLVVAQVAGGSSPFTHPIAKGLRNVTLFYFDRLNLLISPTLIVILALSKYSNKGMLNFRESPVIDLKSSGDSSVWF